jgi:hypothetical protein
MRCCASLTSTAACSLCSLILMARRWLRLIAMIGTVHIAKSATSLGCWLRILAIIAPRNCVLASVYEVAVGVVGAARSASSFRAIWPTSSGFVPLEAHVERQQRCLYEVRRCVPRGEGEDEKPYQCDLDWCLN